MPLDLTQLTALNANILAAVDGPMVAARQAGATGEIANLYNLAASPSFTVWKTTVSLNDVGKVMDGSETANLTTANTSRLQVRAAYMVQGENPSVQSTRDFYDAVFSLGGVSRTAFAILWRRLATRGEKLFATGTGSDASPATPVFQGKVTNDEVVRARSGW